MKNIVSNCPLCEERALHVMIDKEQDIDNQQCINCGYVTSNLFKMHGRGKKSVEKWQSLTDDMKGWSRRSNDRIWIPTIMTLPFGMLYPFNDENGKLKWAYAPMIDIPEEEQKEYPIPDQEGEFYKQKYDTDNREVYDKFVDAMVMINEKSKK